MKTFTMRPMMAPFAPTAATDCVRTSPAKLPTTAISAALKSWPSMAVAAMGSAKRGILSHSEPCSMSSRCFPVYLFFISFPHPSDKDINKGVSDAVKSIIITVPRKINRSFIPDNPHGQKSPQDLHPPAGPGDAHITIISSNISSAPLSRWRAQRRNRRPPQIHRRAGGARTPSAARRNWNSCT